MKVKIIARNYFRVEIGNQANLIFMNIVTYSIDLQNLNPKKAALTIRYSSLKSFSKLFLLDLFSNKNSLFLFKYRILGLRNKINLDFSGYIKIPQNLIGYGIAKS